MLFSEYIVYTLYIMPRINKTKRTKTRRPRYQKTSKYKSRKGGKAFGSTEPVKLVIKDDKGQILDIPCEVCKNNHYEETPGALNKSKLRSNVGKFLFGEMAENLDTTSIIAYFCNICGHARMIRNRDPLRIVSIPLSSVPPPPPPPQNIPTENPNVLPPPPPPA